MGKLIGIALVLAVLCIALAIHEPKFFQERNILNLSRQIGFLGIYALGAGIVILTGGIDLSVGSLMGLLGVLLAIALVEWNLPIPAAIAFCLAVAAMLGWFHGILITKARLQPFVVTLCGLLIYRGAARWIAEDSTKGFGSEFTGLKVLANGHIGPIPYSLLLLLAVAALLGFLVHFSTFGRHLFAVGGNEQAARYSGVPVDRVKTVAYILAATLTGFAAILIALYTNAIQPASHGQFYELYAIAAAVLGGCSLRGGAGTVPGVLLGAALIQILWNAVTLLGIKSYLEYAVIGGVILAGAIIDETLRRRFHRTA